MESKFLGSTGLAKFLENLYNVFSKVGHTHTKSQIVDLPTIPSRVGQLTNDSGFVTAEQVTLIIPVDSSLSNNSENPVQNKIIKTEFDIVHDLIGEDSVRAQISKAIDDLEIELDPTLTIEGMAADAKAVGDQIRDAGSIDIELEGSNEGETNPINADTLGGFSINDLVKKTEMLIPPVSDSDNGKFLKVVDGTPRWQTVPSAEEVGF